MKLPIQRITTFEKLLGFLPKLAELHKTLEGKWEADLTTEEFTSKLMSKFRSHNYFFGLCEGDSIVYFAAIEREGDNSWAWLLYINPNCRDYTRDTLLEIKQLLKQDGVKRLDSNTTRLTSSYRRWMEKFEAKPYMITYRMEL